MKALAITRSGKVEFEKDDNDSLMGFTFSRLFAFCNLFLGLTSKYGLSIFVFVLSTSKFNNCDVN